MRPATLRYRIGRLTAVVAVGLGVVLGSTSLASAAAPEADASDSPDSAVESGTEASDETAPDDFQWD